MDTVLLVREDVAGGDLDVVDRCAGTAVRQIESIVQCQGGVRVLVSVQIPVRVGAKHDGRLLRRGESRHAEVPLVRCYGVRDICNHVAWEAFFPIGIDKVKGNGIDSVSDDGPVAVVPAVAATVEGVEAVVVVELRVVRLAVDAESAVLDAVGIASGYAVKMRVESRL